MLRTFPPDYKVVFVGDATMSPYELIEVGGANEHWNDEPGVKWLARVRETWRHSVWLNPQPEDWWEGHQSIQIVAAAARGSDVPAHAGRARRRDQGAALSARSHLVENRRCGGSGIRPA